MRRYASTVAVAVAAATAVVYLAAAAQLIAYPWDWAPDEGLSLDLARRIVESPGTLFARTVVPTTVGYPPLLSALLVPVVFGSDHPLGAARGLALVWTAVLVGATYALVRRSAPAALALVSAALVLAPLDLSFWFVLVRMDGLMTALWLAGAAVLLPPSLRPGPGLAWPRLLLGTALLFGAVLAKPTAALHAAPLVLGWLAVHRPTAVRLIVVLGAAGAAAIAFLHVATGGGFWWVLSLWPLHTRQPGLMGTILVVFATIAGLVLAYAAAGVLAARRSGGGAADPALLLLAGGLLAVPALSKGGAWWNYLLPAYVAAVVVGGRAWGRADARSERVGAAGVALGSALVAVLLATRTFPLPDAKDEATARAFYSFVGQRGAPILAVWPEYAYVHVGQPVEVEGSGFAYLAAARVEGIGLVLDRIRTRHYRAIVAAPYQWPNDREFEQALTGSYSIAGACELGFFFGRPRFVLLVPRGDTAAFAPPPDARCAAVAR